MAPPFSRLVAAALPSGGTDMAAATAFTSSSALRPGLAPLRRWRALSCPAPLAAYSTSSSPCRAARYVAPLGAFSFSRLPPSFLLSPGVAGALWGMAGCARRRRLTVALEACGGCQAPVGSGFCLLSAASGPSCGLSWKNGVCGVNARGKRYRERRREGGRAAVPASWIQRRVKRCPVMGEGLRCGRLPPP